MEPTTITVHPAFPVAEVDPRLFGGFLEHMGRAVYGGVFDPDSAHADEHGVRRDVLEQLLALDITVVRYPGGNFVSGYHWRDGVGPVERRPAVRELAWRSIEPNTFGTDEFLGLCTRTGWQPMLAVNLGTGGPEEARDLVDYVNAPTGTRNADLRAAHGHEEPYGVTLWCLGNEMDGPWQLGHTNAQGYAHRAKHAAKLMRRTDPSLEFVVCGTSHPDLPTYLDWDRTVLEEVGGYATYLSVHRYAQNHAGDTEDFLASPVSLDRQIEQVDAVCRYVQGRRRSSRRTYLCFDEWNVWYRELGEDGGFTVAPPLLEERYNLEDALVVAGYLNSFVRHADVVKIANLAQLVNVIAPILTRGDDLLVQTIYHPFRMVSQRRAGTSLRIASRGPSYESRSHGTVPVVDSAAILGDGRLSLMMVNRSTRQSAPVVAHLDGSDLRVGSVTAAETLTADAPDVGNTFDAPGRVAPAPLDGVTLEGGAVTVELPPLSFTAIDLTTTA